MRGGTGKFEKQKKREEKKYRERVERMNKKNQKKPVVQTQAQAETQEDENLDGVPQKQFSFFLDKKTFDPNQDPKDKVFTSKKNAGK